MESDGEEENDSLYFVCDDGVLFQSESHILCQLVVDFKGDITRCLYFYFVLNCLTFSACMRLHPACNSSYGHEVFSSTINIRYVSIPS